MALPVLSGLPTPLNGIITGGGAFATADSGALITGAAWNPGTYTFWIPVVGLRSLDVNIRLSGKTGGAVDTARMYKVMRDGQTQIASGASRLNTRSQLKVVTGTNPAANTECSDAVPANKIWRLRSALYSLVTSATVATRRTHITLDDGTTVFYRRGSNQTQAASLTQNTLFATEAQEAAVRATWVADPLPITDLGSGYRIRTVTENLQAADDYAAPIYYVEEFDDTSVNLGPTLAANVTSGASLGDLDGDSFVAFELVVAGGDTVTLSMAEWKGSY